MFSSILALILLSQFLKLTYTFSKSVEIVCLKVIALKVISSGNFKPHVAKPVALEPNWVLGCGQHVKMVCLKVIALKVISSNNFSPHVAKPVTLEPN